MASNLVIHATEQQLKDAMNLLKKFEDDGQSKVGIFWYNCADNSLFGVEKEDASICLRTSILYCFL